MPIKPHALVAAYLSLLDGRHAHDGAFTLPGVLFTMGEIAQRANELFPSQRKPATQKSVRRYLLGESAAGCDVLFDRGLGGAFAQYVRLIHPSALYDATPLHQAVCGAADVLAATGQAPLGQPRQLAQDYFDYVASLPAPVQQVDPALTPRVAVWIAAAALAYNEHLRTGAANEAAYHFKQVAINNLAKTFYQVDGKGAASAGFTTYLAVMGEKNSRHQYFVPVSANGKARRLAAPFEAKKTRPLDSELPGDFEVATFAGPTRVAELVAFVEGPYAQMARSFEPAAERTRIQAELRQARTELAEQRKEENRQFRAEYKAGMDFVRAMTREELAAFLESDETIEVSRAYWAGLRDAVQNVLNRERWAELDRAKAERPPIVGDELLQCYRDYVCPRCFRQPHECTCRDEQGRPVPPGSLVGIDRGLQEHIQILNDKGYHTAHCCEGHYVGGGPYIHFAASHPFGSSLPGVPQGFKWERRHGTVRAITPPAAQRRKMTLETWEPQRQEQLKALLDWCRSLPQNPSQPWKSLFE